MKTIGKYNTEVVGDLLFVSEATSDSILVSRLPRNRRRVALTALYVADANKGKEQSSVPSRVRLVRSEDGNTRFAGSLFAKCAARISPHFPKRKSHWTPAAGREGVSRIDPWRRFSTDSI